MEKCTVLLRIDAVTTNGISVDRFFYAQTSDEIFNTLRSDLTHIYGVTAIQTDYTDNAQSKADIDYALKVLSEGTSHYYPLPVDNILDGWMCRERSRFNAGTYVKLPSSLTQKITFNPLHYAHIPTSDNASLDSIAYTENPDKGRRDVQNTVKLGRYLKKFYPDMPDAEIQEFVKVYRAARTPETFKLEITTDTETINEIFETSMSARDGNGYISCMYGKFSGWEQRPYHVYANSPDVAVAYIRDNAGIIARSVISTRHNHFVRIYSVLNRNDSELSAIERETLCTNFAETLKTAGFKEDDLDGSRLSKVTRNGSVIAPYLDGTNTVTDSGKYWLVDGDGDGDYTFGETTGYPTGNEPRFSCSDCSYQTNDEDALTSTENGNVCSSCADNYTSAIYNRHGDTRIENCDDTVTDCAGDVYTRSYADNDLVYQNGEYHVSDCADLEVPCDECGNDFKSEDLEDGLCEHCATDNKTCVDCDSKASHVNDYETSSDGSRRCDDCTEEFDAKTAEKEYQNANQPTFIF